MLTVLDNTELAQLLHSPILERIKLHHWPLSLIEEIRTPDSRFILKSQLSCAGVERAFYQNVRHPIVLSPRANGSLGNCDYLILPYAGNRAEDWSGFSNEEIRNRVRQFSREFQQLENAPVFYDFSAHAQFISALEEIRTVLLSGGLSETEFAWMISWVTDAGKACWDAPVGLLHGDLKGENILRSDDGTVCVIDWQRPLYGPLPLEESIALLLEGRTAADKNIFDILAQLYLAHWYAWAYRTCLPVPFVLGMAVKHVRACLESISRR